MSCMSVAPPRRQRLALHKNHLPNDGPRTWSAALYVNFPTRRKAANTGLKAARSTMLL